jgi:hypothetical protein
MLLLLRRALPRSLTRLGGVVLALGLYALLTAGVYRTLSGGEAAPGGVLQVVTTQPPPRRNIALVEGQFHVDGAPFLVKAVGWDPTRPGELPWTRKLQPEVVEEDFRRIRAAGFNTLRSWAPLSAEELTLAERHGLKVVQGIWVPPDGDFADPVFRRHTLAQVAGSVEASRWSPAVLAYLVLNEPRARAVAGAGLDATSAFLRELVATVRALDPSAPVGYASWPGLEALDDALLDFVAFNLYPHRPRVVMDELGLGGYARLIRGTVARGRPLLISEFGVSVSPGNREGTPGRGRATLSQQAAGLASLSRTFAGAGVAGSAVFQWNDGWWKNNEEQGDELTHDPDDPEEWFGLIGFEGPGDSTGKPRPALQAMSAFNRAVLVSPEDGQVGPGPVPVRVHAEGAVRLQVSVDQGPAVTVPLQADRAGWHHGLLELPGGGTRHRVDFTFLDERGAELRTEDRLLRTAAPRTAGLTLSPAHQRLAPGARFSVVVQGQGDAGPGTSVTVAAFTEDRFNEEKVHLRLGRDGKARVTLRAPAETTLLTLLAFEDDPALPPAERAAARAVIEVRPAP